jgi:ML domain
MRVVSVFFVAIVLAAVCVRANEWEACDVGNTLFAVTGVTTDPPTGPVAGQSFTIVVDGDLSAEITGGTLTMDTKYNGFPLGSQSDDFCTSVQPYQPCPWAPGKQQLRMASSFPSGAPAGSYVITVTAKTDDGKPSMCITGSFKI